MGIDSEKVDWGRASIIFGLSDVRGIKERVDLRWNGETYASESALPHRLLVNNGISIPIPLSADISNLQFSTKLSFNGSGGISLTPVGNKTTARLASPWENPSFTGFSLTEQPELRRRLHYIFRP